MTFAVKLAEQIQVLQGALDALGIRRLFSHENPRVAARAPSGKHHIAARLCAHRLGVRGRKHVAAARDGHRNCLFHLSNQIPVGLAPIELPGTTPMHGYHARASLLKHLRELGRTVLTCLPARANLGRDGHVHGMHKRGDDARSKPRLLHQGRAFSLARHLAHGTSHVHVNRAKARTQALLYTCGRMRHELGVAAEELHGDVFFRRCRVHESPGLLAAVAQAGRAHHLGEGEARTVRGAYRAKCLIRDPCHGSKPQRPGKRRAESHVRRRRELVRGFARTGVHTKRRACACPPIHHPL